jgi:hypothetical protein
MIKMPTVASLLHALEERVRVLLSTPLFCHHSVSHMPVPSLYLFVFPSIISHSHAASFSFFRLLSPENEGRHVPFEKGNHWRLPALK